MVSFKCSMNVFGTIVIKEYYFSRRMIRENVTIYGFLSVFPTPKSHLPDTRQTVIKIKDRFSSKHKRYLFIFREKMTETLYEQTKKYYIFLILLWLRNTKWPRRAEHNISTSRMLSVQLNYILGLFITLSKIYNSATRRITYRIRYPNTSITV